LALLGYGMHATDHVIGRRAELARLVGLRRSVELPQPGPDCLVGAGFFYVGSKTNSVQSSRCTIEDFRTLGEQFAHLSPRLLARLYYNRCDAVGLEGRGCFADSRLACYLREVWVGTKYSRVV